MQLTTCCSIMVLLIAMPACARSADPPIVELPPAEPDERERQSFSTNPLLQRLANGGAHIATNSFTKGAPKDLYTTILFDNMEFTVVLGKDLVKVRKLHSVDFQRCMFQPGSLKALCGLPLPVRLSFFDKCDLGVGALAELDGCMSINALDFRGTAATDRTFAGLTCLPRLCDFDCSNSQVTATGLSFLARCPRLESLSLQGTALDDDSLAKLVAGHDLAWLNVAGTMVTDEVTMALSALSNLRYLWLVGCDITDTGAKRLGKLNKLKNLGLGHTHITDEGLSHLRALRDLETLDVSNTMVTDAGAKYLAGLTRLRKVANRGTRMTADAIERATGRDVGD